MNLPQAQAPTVVPEQTMLRAAVPLSLRFRCRGGVLRRRMGMDFGANPFREGNGFSFTDRTFYPSSIMVWKKCLFAGFLWE